MQGKRVSVLGMGKSGMALVRELKKHGAEPFISDTRPSEQLQDQIAQIEKEGAEYESGKHSTRVLQTDMLIISPGVSIHSPMVQEALARGVF